MPRPPYCSGIVTFVMIDLLTPDFVAACCLTADFLLCYKKNHNLCLIKIQECFG
jgi:hypothetical protein